VLLPGAGVDPHDKSATRSSPNSDLTHHASKIYFLFLSIGCNCLDYLQLIKAVCFESRIHISPQVAVLASWAKR
jgi:hypothetical protein